MTEVKVVQLWLNDLSTLDTVFGHVQDDLFASHTAQGRKIVRMRSILCLNSWGALVSVSTMQRADHNRLLVLGRLRRVGKRDGPRDIYFEDVEDAVLWRDFEDELAEAALRAGMRLVPDPRTRAAQKRPYGFRPG